MSSISKTACQSKVALAETIAECCFVGLFPVEVDSQITKLSPMNALNSAYSFTIPAAHSFTIPTALGMVTAHQKDAVKNHNQQPKNAMNKIKIQSAPEGNFQEVSIYQTDWPDRFLSLVRQGKLVRYNIHTMPGMPDDVPDQIRAELAWRGYREFILESDNFERFLVPAADQRVLAKIRSHPKSR